MHSSRSSTYSQDSNYDEEVTTSRESSISLEEADEVFTSFNTQNTQKDGGKAVGKENIKKEFISDVQQLYCYMNRLDDGKAAKGLLAAQAENERLKSVVELMKQEIHELTTKVTQLKEVSKTLNAVKTVIAGE